MEDTKANGADLLRRVTYLTTSVGGSAKRECDTWLPPKHSEATCI